MKIAQVAPLYESVPPKLYGGSERVVSYLTEELIAQGHEVTLFASGDSITRARLVAPCARALRLDPKVEDRLAYHFIQLDQVLAEAESFDLIHFHVGYLHFPLVRRWATRHLTTVHGRLDIDDLVPLFKRFGEIPLVSISDAQRLPLPWATWLSTVYHGLPMELLRYNHAKKQSYLAFLGRISPEKRLDRAIEIATRAGIKLKIAAKVDNYDRDYFHREIEPL